MIADDQPNVLGFSCECTTLSDVDIHNPQVGGSIPPPATKVFNSLWSAAGGAPQKGAHMGLGCLLPPCFERLESPGSRFMIEANAPNLC